MGRSQVTIPSNVRIVMTAAWVMRHWVVLWLSIFTLFNVLPYLAPALMRANIEPLGNSIYNGYGLISHQMAHRSFFFFGEQVVYSLDAFPVTLVGEFVPDSTVLRQFRGNEVFGWKVAWSDRLVALFGSALVTSFAYALLRQRERFSPLHVGWMLLLCAPLVIDGSTHYISDFDGVMGGFRWDNPWLVALTGNQLSESFYVGDRWGSFNSLTRLITGILFGVGLWSWGLGRVDRSFDRTRNLLEKRLDNWWQRQLEVTSENAKS